MSETTSQLRLSASIAGRTAIIVALVIVAMGLVRALLNRVFDGNWGIDLSVTFMFAAIMGGGWFLILFASTFSKIREGAAIDDIQSRNPPSVATPLEQGRLRGFVAMEYYFLFLNRSFLIFISPEGLYGWKFEGVVDASNPSFFQPYADMLNDPEFMRSPAALEEMAMKRGNFFIPRIEIASADFSYDQKWGMGGIPHSGKLYVQLASGKKREFILLGAAYGEGIRQAVLSGAAQ